MYILYLFQIILAAKYGGYLCLYDSLTSFVRINLFHVTCVSAGIGWSTAKASPWQMVHSKPAFGL